MEQQLTFIRQEGFAGISNMIVVGVYMTNNKDPMEALKAGITEWVETTQEGKDEWEGSCEDFNIGDLLMASDDELMPILRKHGIAGLRTIYAHDPDLVYPYDTILAEPSEDVDLTSSYEKT